MAKGLSRTADPAGRLFFALDHPIRLQIVRALTRGPASASAIGKALDIKVITVAYHLRKVLWEECDLVEIISTHQRRGALETVYALRSRMLAEAFPWAEVPQPLRPAAQGAALNCFLENAIAALEAESQDPESEGQYRFLPVAADADGQRRIRAAIEELTATVAAVEERCASSAVGPLTQLIVGSATFEAVPLPGEKGR